MVKKRHADKILDAVQSPSQAAVSMLVASWRRSLMRHHLDPAQRSNTDFITLSELKILRESNETLLSVSQIVLDRVFRSVGTAGCCVALTDLNGIILEQRSTTQDKSDFITMRVAEGGCWGEAHVGTNGIGTCLYENKPVTIYRDQHFAEQNTTISCMDAPIYDPLGRLVAALDISNCRDDFSPAMANMVSALVLDAARQIECAYFQRYFAHGRIVFIQETPQLGTAMLAVDRDDIVIGATRAARSLLNLNDDHLTAGRSLDQLTRHDEMNPSFIDAERAVLRQALASVGGNASKAAKQLGIARATLYRRMARIGLKANAVQLASKN